MITITPIIKDQSDTKRFPETIPGAFCNKNYKFIRVAVDSISRLCLALFYQIISYCYKVVGSSTARYYESLANYQNRKVKNFFTYLRIGNEILDFSLNSSRKFNKPYIVNKEGMLRNIYGDDAVDQLMQTQVENIHFFKDKLCKLEMESSGYCLGMSFDFISNYLMSINSVKPGLEIFVTRYKDGAPDKAELGHILYSAMCKYLIKKNPQLKNLNRQLAKTKKRLNYSKYKLKSFKKKRKKMTPKEQKAWTVKLTEETLKTNRKIEKLHIDGENLRLELALKKTLP